MRVILLLILLWLGGCGPATTETLSPVTAAAPAPAYARQLARLAVADQADRQRLFAIFKQHGFRSLQADTGNRWLLRRDSIRFIRFRALLARYGWPRRAQVGPEGLGAAFLFVQHSSDSVHASFRSAMQAAFQRKELPAGDWATYLDRYLLNHGRPQRYGTQRERRVLANGREEDYLSPVENPATLDARRRALGLDSLTPELRPGTLVLEE